MTRRAVLLVNLGSPDSPSEPDVRRYLEEFLMDPRVLDSPWPIRWAVVHWAILPSRPKDSAHAYSTIWTPEGSPLIVTSRRLRDRLARQVPVPIALAMRYGNPSIEDVVRELVTGAEPVEEIHLVPLYPHYAMSSYETVEVAVRNAVKRLAPATRLSVLPPFYAEPLYVRALVDVARPYLDAGFDHLLFSYHGIPVRHLRKTDPTGAHCQVAADCCQRESPATATCYKAQCLRTTSAFVAAAGVPEERWSVSFQSRLGKEPWIEPYTDVRLVELAESGVKRLLVICPSFVADCLETLEEIDARGRESFLAAGGESFTMIPCLNEHPSWVGALAAWLNARLGV